MEDIITRNIQTFTTPIHDTTLQVFDPGASVGVTMYLEGHGVRWSNWGYVLVGMGPDGCLG